MLLLATLLLIATTVSRNIADHVSPSMRSRPQVKSVQLGSSVEFVCSVANQDEHKVQWWFDNHNRQISSNADVLTDDTHKYNVWQPKGSSGVWILHISNVSVMDAGHYRCDISSTGLTMTSRLQVTEAVLPFVPRPENIPRANFTGCCMEMGVAQHCLPICSPRTFNPSSFDMVRCDSYMTQLLHCGSDGSNHIPCCRRRHVPTQCLDICLGKLPKEMDESHMVCPRKTLDILACFEEGKLLLPGPPKGLLVRAISPTKLYVKWHAPDKNGDSVIGYYIFYQRGGSTDYRSSALVLDVSYRIENLDAATAYNLYVVAVNEHGTSLPSYIIHINTPQSRPNRRPPLNLFPDPGYLPECCRQHGVTQDCQPILCSDTPVQDRQHLRRCLPEFNKVLACFAGERNHTDCCVRREVPGVCLPLCGGAPSGVNFQLLSCMRYVSDISSCVREGYNSIPGPPLDVRLGKVTSHEASLEWDPPVYGRAPVKAYLVQYKEQSAVVYTKMTTTETSATLTTLRSSTLYTVKVSSLGHNGTSLPSPSLIFLTYSPSGGVLLSTTTTLIPPITPPPHDIARCCRNQTVEEHCLTLCNYDIDFRAISPEVVGVCTRNLHAILQCAVDGRNHTRCCQKRGVHAQCRKFCEFSQHDIDKYQLTDEDGVCVFEMPSLVQCMKEGVAQLPSPPRQLTAINTTLNTISLTWLAPAQQPQGVTGYLVEYHQAKLPGPWLPLKTSAPHVILQNLDPDTKYVIRVSAYNDLGESLPSYRLVQQTLTTPGAEKSLNFTAHINIEACCREKNVLAECMPACNNSASVSYKQCHLELPKLVVCSADGRDHSDCCKRREVPANCLGFCQGSLPKSAFISYLCMASLPQILTCFRVGLPMLPSPPRDFHLEGQGSRWLQFAWTQPLKNGHDVRYSLQYQESINDDIAWINTIDNIRTVQHKLDHLLPFRQYTVRVQAVNRFGNSVPSAKVVVWTLQETPLRVSISQAPPGYIREHATSVTLTCQAVGDPPPFIHWLRNGVIHNDSTYSLQGVRHSDTGRYTCVARNNIGKVSSLDHYIKIQFLPKVVANVTQITRSPGQVLLTCGFRGYPERISWSRDGQNITGPDGWHDRRFVTRVIDEKVGIVESRLTIVLATKSDYGTYLCRAENDFGAVDALLMLKDNSEEHIEPFHPTTKYSSLSECCEARGVSVKCRVACSFDIDLGAIKDALMNPLVCVPDLPAIIQCGADGKDHSQCCRNNRVPAECLAVCAGNVDALTSGHIACIAHIAAITTCMETGQKNIPSPPRNVKALLSHGYISVSWDAPAKNRDKVTFYKVNYRRATVGPTLQVKLGPQSGGVNLTRIHGHTQYYINVTSGNHHGNSAPSDTIVITTLELMPSAPRNFTGHLVDGMSVRLSWEMPIKNPGAILGYLITYAVSGAHTRHTENISDVLTYKLENLAPQTTYTIFVRAQSSHFIGPRSKVITVATQASEGYFQQHFGGTTKVGLGIGLTFAVMVMVVVVGFALFWHIRKRAGSEHQFEDSVAFENPTYTTAGTPRISGLPNGATSSLGSSTELVAGSIMKETDSSSSDQGYATLSTPTAPNKDDKTMATLHTSAASDV